VFEIALVLGTLLALGLGSAAWAEVPPDVLLVAGFWLIVAGLAFGLPTGAVYHVALHRSLLRAGVLPRRWWLHPTSHHRLLPADDAPSVLAWCRAGALGCAVVFVGCAVAGLGAWKAIAAG
jgi:hypothetical protein